MAVSLYGICRYAVVTKYYKSLDDVVEFADVSTPVSMCEYVDSLAVDVLNRYAVARAYLGNKVVDKKANILATIP